MKTRNTPPASEKALGVFIAKATRYLFFTGKGGVGKTIIAAAA